MLGKWLLAAALTVALHGPAGAADAPPNGSAQAKSSPTSENIARADKALRDATPDAKFQAPDLPIDVQAMGERVSRYAEKLQDELGLSDDDFSYCFTKLNIEMNKNPEWVSPDPKYLAEGEGRTGQLHMMEGYYKTYLRTCLTDVGNHLPVNELNMDAAK